MIKLCNRLLFTIAIFFSFFVNALHAADHITGKFTVKGVVADELTKEGEQYATMKITPLADSTATAALAVTERDGAFCMTLAKAGDYRLTVNAMGRQPIVRQFSVSANQPQPHSIPYI